MLNQAGTFYKFLFWKKCCTHVLAFVEILESLHGKSVFDRYHVSKQLCFSYNKLLLTKANKPVVVVVAVVVFVVVVVVVHGGGLGQEVEDTVVVGQTGQ